jgi:putative membrane protein
MKTAASAEGVAPAETLMPDHQSQLDNLSGLSAEEFDAAYLAAQLAAHVEAVTLFEGYANQGQDGALKDFAAETLPKLQDHKAKVEPLAQQ